MDNLHNVGRTKSFTTTRKMILKLVELGNVATCKKYSFAIFTIFLYIFILRDEKVTI